MDQPPVRENAERAYFVPYNSVSNAHSREISRKSVANRTDSPPKSESDPSAQYQQRERPMGGRADKAWRAAAACARLAQAARDDADRDFYVRMRNAWFTVGNQSQFAEGLEREDSVVRPLPASGLLADAPAPRPR